MYPKYLVSIVINNYNYACFLRSAIESALQQSYDRVEIIIVDDGSTDESRDIVAEYEGRVTVVLKENGGQGSALNAGFELCNGDIVIFLDSDDKLMPHVVAEIVGVFQKNPNTSKVQYRLELIDAQGDPIGVYMPPIGLPMLSGDLSRHMLRFPDDVRMPPTSGNAFAASTLRQLAPVPKAAFGGTTGADLYFSILAPLFGPVETLPSIGGCYRVHGSNNHYTSGLNVDRIRDVIGRTFVNHGYIKQYAHRLQLFDRSTGCPELLPVTHLINRIASLRLDPTSHPIKEDSKSLLLWLGIRASIRRFDLPVRTRLIYIVWFIAAVSSPKPVTRWLVTKAFYPERRGVLNRLV